MLSVTKLNFGPYEYAMDRGLSRNGLVIDLPPRVRSLLGILLDARGGVVDKTQIAEAIRVDRDVTDDSISRAVYLLRVALGDQDDHRIVKTVHGVGFQIGVEVVEVIDGRRAHLPFTQHVASGEDMIRTAFEIASQRTDRQLQLAGSVLGFAFERFPTLAMAPALQADVEIARMIRGYIRPRDSRKRAFDLVEKSLEIQPGLPMALATKGWLMGVLDDDLERGLHMLDIAISAAPSVWLTYFYKAWLEIGARDLDAANRTIEIGLALSPLERSLISLKAWLICVKGDYRAANAYLSDMITLRPDVELLWIVRAILAVLEGESQRALSFIQEATQRYPDDTFVTADFIWVLAKTGQKDWATAILAEPKRGNIYVSPTKLAMIRFALDDEVGARNLLDIARVDRCPWRLLAWCDPRIPVSLRN